MELILWRHAEAEAGVGKRLDHKRRLTPRGERQARGMAAWLRERLSGKKVAVLASPTQRTRQTAHALGLPYEIEPRIGPGADARDLLEAAGWSPSRVSHDGTVILVGHQPTLGQVAALLLSGAEVDWTVKKGAIWWFSREIHDGKARATLRATMGADLA